MAGLAKQVGGRAVSYLSVRRGRHLHLMEAGTAQPNVMRHAILVSVEGTVARLTHVT